MPKIVPSIPGHEPGSTPYSPAVEANGFVFLAGQVGNAPGGTSPVPGGIEAETRQMLDNARQLLEAVGLGLDDVVRCTVYLRDFAAFAAMNAVFRSYFAVDPPVRATLGVAALAGDFRIEIDVTAAR
jgi:2-iminobutanoate/2-iminopropanoate deaminase